MGGSDEAEGCFDWSKGGIGFTFLMRGGRGGGGSWGIGRGGRVNENRGGCEREVDEAEEDVSAVEDC
jgi:hypothetical protein